MKHSYAKIDARKVIELCLAEKSRLAYRCQEEIEQHIEKYEGRREFPIIGKRWTRQSLIDEMFVRHDGFAMMEFEHWWITGGIDRRLERISEVMRLAQRSITNGDGYVRLTTEDHELIR